jgi:hypothetical protein
VAVSFDTCVDDRGRVRDIADKLIRESFHCPVHTARRRHPPAHASTHPSHHPLASERSRS